MQRSYQNQQQRGSGLKDFLTSLGLAVLIFKWVPIGIVGVLALGKVNHFFHELDQLNRCTAEGQLAGGTWHEARTMCKVLIPAGVYKPKN